MLDLKIDANLCTSCKQCIKVCSELNIMTEDGKAALVSAEKCIGCFHCVSVCPQKAISYDSSGYTKSLAQLIDFEVEGICTADELEQMLHMRRTTRNFKEDKPADEDIKRIINAAVCAPTAGNRQPLRFAVVRDRVDELTKLSILSLCRKALSDTQARYAEKWNSLFEMYERHNIDRLFYHAPVVIAIIGNKSITKKLEYDCGIAAENMSLMAEAMGLGTCMNLFFAEAAADDSEIKAMLKVSDDEIVLLGLAVGYKDIEYRREVARKIPDVLFL